MAQIFASLFGKLCDSCWEQFWPRKQHAVGKEADKPFPTGTERKGSPICRLGCIDIALLVEIRFVWTSNCKSREEQPHTMSHEDQLEIEVAAAEIVEEPLLLDVSPEIKDPSRLSFQLSPARSSAFSTPSRSPSRHSSFGAAEDLDDDVPSAVYSSFSQSPGATASNPTTPERKTRISTTVTISPKRGSSPGFSEIEMMPSLPPTPERGAENDQSAHDQTAASASPGASPGVASLRSVAKTAVTPNQNPGSEAVDHSAPLKPKTVHETNEAVATVTPNQSPDKEAFDQSATVQPKTPDKTSAAKALVTPTQGPGREAGVHSAPFVGANPARTPERKFSSEQSAPEKDTFDRSKTDPNYTLRQIALGTSAEHLTPERTHFSKSSEENNAYAAVPAPPPEYGTPRVSNQEHSYVESVSSGMQQVFHSLRTFMTVDSASEQGSNILDTSMESDSLTDFDIQELAREIRELNKGKDEKKEQNETEGRKKELPPQTSKASIQAHAPVKIPRAASRSPAAVLSRSRSRKERMEKINSNTALATATPNLPPEARSGKSATEITQAPSAPSSSSASPPALVPSTPTRASIRNDGGMTPIMRMRTTGSPESAVVEPSPPRASDEEVKASKQRKWKDKLKLAEKKKEQERRMLDGRERRKEVEGDKEGRGRSKKRSKERRRKSSKKKTQASKKRENAADANFMQCSDGFSKLMETVMQGRCGALNDTFSIFDEGSDTDGSFESGSESGSEEYEKGTSTDEGESEEESELPVWKGGKRRSRGGGVRFEPEAHVAEKDAASGSIQSHPSSQLPERTIGRISLHEKAVEEDPNNVGIHGKNFIHSFISNATTRGIILFLHKKSRKQSFTQSSKMTALLKLGPEQADGSFGGPKFVWMAYDGIQAGRIDLFDIRAVDKATPLQLQHYPLAMPGRSFIIKMNRSPDCVFEAMDEEAAVRFVHGMRWVVARLAFNLIIGNMDVSCELLDIGKHEDNHQKTRIPPQSPVEEAQWSMAMNSLTNHLVDKASLFTTQ